MIKNADRKDLSEIAIEISELACRAREGRLTPSEMELEAHPDWPSAMVQSGTARNSGARLHEGQNNVTLWNAGPARFSVPLPGFPYDQFVLVLKGQLVLTDTNANSATYDEGDMFMIPRGWPGTWDMTEEYREFIIVPGE